MMNQLHLCTLELLNLTGLNHSPFFVSCFVCMTAYPCDCAERGGAAKVLRRSCHVSQEAGHACPDHHHAQAASGQVSAEVSMTLCSCRAS